MWTFGASGCRLAPAKMRRMSTAVTARLLNPAADTFEEYDELTRRLFRATVEWFEAKGKTSVTAEVHTDVWYSDFISFLDAERAFATLLTPERDASAIRPSAGTPHRNAMFNEILGFYGLPYWYAWQVTILGLGPIWQSDNDAARMRAARPARRRRGVRVWPLRARARCRHLFDRHDPHSGRRRRLPRKRRQVLHRQRQRGRHGFGLRSSRRRGGHRRLRLLRRRQRAPRLQAPSRTSSTAALCERVRPRGLSGPAGGYAAHAASRPSRRRSTPSTSASSTSASARSAWPSTASTRPITQAESRILFGKRVTEFGQVRRILSEAYARLLAAKFYGPARSTMSAAPAARIAATCSSPRSTRCR